MKLTSIILLATCLTASARGFTQTINISMKNASLEKVFTEIKKQTGYSIFCNYELLEKSKPVTINVKNASIDEVMKLCLKDQDLDYRISEKSILVKEKVQTPNVNGGNENITPLPPPIDVTGKVTDPDGNPLAGANIKVKGTNQGTTTDGNGVFVLKGVGDNATLEISYVGFQTLIVPVNGKTSIVTALKVNSSPLDEMQVIAYGAKSKRFQTGNVSSIISEDIAKQPINNPLLALQGQVPGATITQSSGVAGSAVTIQIRGINSISNKNWPLYIIDGVPYTSQLLPNLGSNILRQANNDFSIGAGNPLGFISPSDIESISVLKDADATAIYGSRGANGVVLITTKKGKAGKSKVDIDISSGFGSVAHKMNLMNTKEYLQMRREAFKNDGVTPSSSNAPDLLVWDTTKYTDWQEKFIGNKANYTDARASMSGGSSNVQYLFGGAYHKETTVFPGDFSDTKISSHFNISSTSANGKLKASFFGSYVADMNKLPSSDFTSYVTLAPNTPDLLNPDGTLNWSNNTLPDGNPYSSTLTKYNIRTNNLVSSLTLRYEIFKGLEVLSNLGYTNMNVNEKSQLPISALNPAIPNRTGRSSFTNNDIHSWITESQLIYRTTIRNSKFEALFGSTFNENVSAGQIVSVTGYTNDALLDNIQAGPNRTISSVTQATYKYNAFFGRLNYNLSNKYILNLTARRDGSSRFGENNKFHNFGSIGGAWLFGEESFMKQNFPFFSYGKLRGSYGTTGNDQIGDYRFYNLFSTSQYSYQGIIGLSPTQHFNPYLQWEETKKMELGLDLGFIKDRILLNISYYDNRSSNQLSGYNVPLVTGFSIVSANLPATVQNYGWELSLNTTNIEKKDFVWTTGVNLTIPTNKLLSFKNIENTSYFFTKVIGQPITINKVFQLSGVNDTTGVYQYIDNKGALTYSPNSLTDNISIINTEPKYYGGITNTIRYKNFQIDFTFQGINRIGNSFLVSSYSAPGAIDVNTDKDVLNRWRNIGDHAPIQRFTQSFTSNASSAYTYLKTSDLAYTDASFVRLKNVSISYKLPESLIKKMHINNCRFYINAQNLFTITGYNGVDPENTSVSALPPLRVVVGGISLSL